MNVRIPLRLPITVFRLMLIGFTPFTALAVTTSKLFAQAKTELAVEEYKSFQAAHKILTAHCIKCHGETKQESGLRLDSPKALLQGGDFGPAVVLQKASESELIQRVSSKSDDEIMPPMGRV